MHKELLTQIKKYERIIIHRHKNPDGDALGSQLGLKEIIQEKFPEKEVLAVGSVDEYKDQSTRNIFKEGFDEVKIKHYENSLVIVCDTANIERIEGSDFFRGLDIFKIDHHKNTEEYGTIEWVDSSISSTSEMISKFARSNKLPVNPTAAKYLLTGMVTDTGRFMFSSVKPETFREAFFLSSNGAKIAQIANKLNDRNINFVRLQGEILSNFSFKKGVAYYMMPEKLEKKFKVDYGTASSLVFLLMSFKEAHYAVYSTYDRKNRVWKTSLRSKKKPIVQIAEEYQGGGHDMAAGLKFKDKKQFQVIVDKLIELNKK